MLAFRSLANYNWSVNCLGCFNRFFTMGDCRSKLAYFRRGKLAHLFSMNKIFQKSIQYFIAFSEYISHILSPKQKILLEKRIHFHGNIYICKSYYISPSMEVCMWVNLPRHVGQLTPTRGKLADVYLPYKSCNFVKHFIYFSWQKHEQKGWSLIQA